ncbi:MAG: hypothetical protein EHM61_22260 [Acidobacteria bacterium]|nr:MAG: hypothetical protein EHM61_22260 [Acidobacteriota bacterium]
MREGAAHKVQASFFPVSPERLGHNLECGPLKQAVRVPVLREQGCHFLEQRGVAGAGFPEKLLSPSRLMFQSRVIDLLDLAL